MKKIITGIVFGLPILALLFACSLNGGKRAADYTVKGNASDYERKDTRVYIRQAITENVAEDGIHDPANDAIKSLQQPAEALQNFPEDRRGGVNWVKAIDEGIVNPRASLKGEEEMLVMDLDILFKDTGQMPHVRFPHLAHTRWLACANCHPAIFKPQKGANDANNAITMDRILEGEFCGRCHDKVAFALWTCERCHSIPHEKSPPAWWRAQDNPMPATPTPPAGALDLD